MTRATVGWCSDCFKELHRGMKLWTRGQDENGEQTVICNDCAKREARAADIGHYATCPFRGDQRLALSA